METLTIQGNHDYISQVIVLLSRFPQKAIQIKHHKEKKEDSAFGILNGKISDPVQWQKDLREENDRDIYGITPE